jgi:hypothetical protein
LQLFPVMAEKRLHYISNFCSIFPSEARRFFAWIFYVLNQGAAIQPNR